MKRLFSRRDNSNRQQQQTQTPLVAVTPPSTTTESNGYNQTNGNGLLHAPSSAARRKPSFFDFTSVARTASQSHSDTSSVPLTGTSISGSSDASSSIVSTPIDETLTLNSAKTLTDATGTTKTWPSWMSSIGKSSIRKQKVAPASNVSRAGGGIIANATLGSTSLRPMASSALTRPSISTTSATSSDSDDSGDSSYEEEEEDDNGNSSRKRRGKLRGRKTIRAPGLTNGGRHLTPHSSSTGSSGRQAAQQTTTRSIFKPHTASAPITRETSKALANLHALTLDALVPPSSAPPLVSTSSSLPFPRSSNRLHTSHSGSSASGHALHSPLHVEILRKRLLRRIERKQLSVREQESIQVLATRSSRPRNADKRKLPSAEETYEDSKAVGGGWSKGMKKWAMRPCFEERAVVWKLKDEGLVVVPVERDSRAAVAALEFTEGAEALAGLHRQNELPPPPSDIYVPASNRKLPPPLVIPRSPTGIGATKPLNPFTASNTHSRLGPSRLRSPVDISLLQSNQDEDDLPLGVVMLQRRQKDEAEERRKRVLQEKAERERKIREEEEKRKKYQEEVLAARNRREVEKAGILASKTKDAWLSGDADALPPPVKPYATHHIKSSSNPNLASSSSATASLQVPNKPVNQRRMTSDSSATSTVTATTTKPESIRQQSAPIVPSPWSALPSGSPRQLTSPLPGLPHSNSFPRMPMPMSAPPMQTGMNYGMMMPPMPDPLSMAMFEQGLLRPWAMDSSGRASPTGSAEMLTPPILPFGMGFGSSGDSSGSLTPPRFPNSRPPSWGSSSEDVRLTIQKAFANGGLGSGPRPISTGSGSGESYDWRRSRSSMFVPTTDEARNRSTSRSPHDQMQLPTSSSLSSKLGHQRINTSTSVAKSGRSEKSEVPSSFSRHQGSISKSSSKAGNDGSAPTPSHRSSSNNLRSSSSNTNLHSTSSSINLRSSSQPRSRTVPIANPPAPPPKNPYGLPTSHSYGPSSGSGLRESMVGSSSGKPGMTSSLSTDAVGRVRPGLHAHSKSSTTTRKSRLFS